MISVIIPVYNVVNYLKECLDSVCNQTYKDLEIICVNDGSTDGSLDILKEYEKQDSRISIISQENKGLSAARNVALDCANGEYIYFLDSDDYIELNALEELYNVSNQKELDIVLFKLLVLDDETNEKSISNYWEMKLLKSIVGENVFNYDDVYHHVRGLFACTMQNIFFRADLIGDLRFIEGVIWEDDPFFLDNLFRAERIYFYDKHLGVKRERKISISNSYFNQFSDCIPTLNMQMEIYKKYGHYDEEFRLKLYEKKYFAIKLRYSQITEEYKKDFYDLLKKDCIDKKEEYESDQAFEKLSDNYKNIFYACLNSKDYEEFELKLNK